MARPAASTTAAIAGFVADGRRLHESQAGLQQLGIDVDHQQYPMLPDGSVDRHDNQLAELIVSYALANGICRVVSLGKSGFDGHPDHIASHQATSQACDILRNDCGQDVQQLSLNGDHHGGHIVASTPLRRERKLGAMACHVSQFDIRRSEDANDSDGRLVIAGFTIGQAFWEGFATYQPLVVDRETYDIAD